MSFGKKLRRLREQQGLTQTQLAQELGTSLKTVSNYEVKDVRPRRMETYQKISDFFGVDINYLLTEEDSFVMLAGDKYGAQGARDARELVSSVTGLFAGGELPEEDKDAIFEALQQAYWESKLENKKYGNQN